MAVLQVEGLQVRYGGVTALWDVSLTVEPGSIVAIIGANGAGKTTLINAISGVLTPARGRIVYRGSDITGKRPEGIVRAGISQVPEGRRVFGNLTVHENLLVGAHLVRDGGVIRTTQDRVYALFPRLMERRGQAAGTLSGGEQQMLAIGRALMSQPRLLMLDEPSLGLSPRLVSEVFRTVAEIRESGTTILLVEQNSRMALRYADHGYVMETGRVILSGSSDQLMGDSNVRRVYLGQEMLGAGD